ncbi:MAG: metallophosphoesterase family protein [Acidimicrobiales bacterium]
MDDEPNEPKEPTAVLVHLSDLHFSIEDPGLEQRRALVRDRVCADLKMLLPEVGRCADAVLVTGDISYGGKAAEYRMASDWFEQVIEPITNGSTRLLAVPGNHDVDWARVGPTHQAHRTHLDGCPDEGLDALLDRYLTEDGQSILYPLDAYNEFAASLDCQIADRFCWDAPLDIGGGFHLEFRGVTTVVNSYKTDRPGGLAVHGNQLLHTPSPGAVPILLAHHDPYFWRQYHRMEREITNRMSVALYGHTHQPRLRKVEQCVEITGGAVHPEEGKDWMPWYNVVRLSITDVAETTATLRVRVWRRRFSTDHDGFIPDAANGLYEDRFVTVPSALQSAAARAEDAPDDEEVRVALTTPEGTPHPVREVQRALYRLGAGDRITLLADIGLAVDDLARLPAHRLIPQAAAAIVDEGRLDAFRAALAARHRAISGGPA